MTGTDRRRILGIHGVRNYRRDTTAENMAARWAEHLEKAYVDPVDFRVTYWAPLMRGPVGQGVTATETQVAESEAVTEWVEALLPANERVSEQIAQGRTTAWLRNALSRIALKYELDVALLRAFVSVFFPELESYLSGKTRAPVRDMHIDDLLDHEPDVVLAHSLGTVITYESLWHLAETNPEFRLPLLVTYGSPLALSPWVMRKLEPSPDARPPGRPPNVARWVNIADIGDVIAIPRHLGSRYADVEDLETEISRWDFHKVGNYLADPINAEVLRSEVPDGPGD